MIDLCSQREAAFKGFFLQIDISDEAGSGTTQDVQVDSETDPFSRSIAKAARVFLLSG